MQPGNQRIYKAIFFTFFFCLLLNEVSTILQKKWPERTATEIRFHSEPKNSIDVLFVGSSSFYRGISPLVLWNEYGFTSYVLANSIQSPLAIYESVEDALKTQKVKLVVLDGIILLNNFNYSDYEAHIRKYVDPIPLSIRKLKLIYAFSKEDNELTWLSFLLPIFRYHSRWSELSDIDFRKFEITRILDTKGQSNLANYIPVEYPKEYMAAMEDQTPLAENARIYYDRIFKLCKENNVMIIFVTLPRMSWNYGSYKALSSYSALNKAPYIDFSFPREIEKVGLDTNSDFLDPYHVNNYGAQKMSIAVGERILQEVMLLDHRADPNFSSWHDLYKTYKDTALDASKRILDIERMNELIKRQSDN